jgi:ketosteroid isomerase-like protein
VEEFIDGGGDDVLMLAHVRARTLRDGVQIEHAPAAVCTLADGRIGQLAFYLDRAEALEAVGLSE